MELNFDIRGNLKPYEIIEISLDMLKATFVDSFDKDSTRHELFSNYEAYMADLDKLITKDFYQWIDGSFISNKKNPKDIDIHDTA